VEGVLWVFEEERREADAELYVQVLIMKVPKWTTSE
jgi:hypothetical protein